MTPADRLAKGRERVLELCEHCRAGHEATWQDHSREWVHLLYQKSSQFAIVICGADGFRKGE